MSVVGELVVIVCIELVELIRLLVEFLNRLWSKFRAELLACKLVVLVINGDILVVVLLLVLHVGAMLIFDGKF